MTALWRMLRVVLFGPKPEAPRDPAVEAVSVSSTAKADRTHQLLAELRSRTQNMPKLDRARLRYDERLYGTGHRAR